MVNTGIEKSGFVALNNPYDSLQAFFISSGFGIRKHLDDQCREVMWYDLTDDRFQIYREGGIQDSLLWLRSNDFSLAAKKGLADPGRQADFRDSISVDLVKSRLVSTSCVTGGHP